VRVRSGQRALVRVVNASATLEHTVAPAGDTVQVIALGGNPVAASQPVPGLRLAQGERADAIGEMKNPGVSIFGETNPTQRATGARCANSIIIEPGKDGNRGAINGKSYPPTDDILLHKGRRNRLVFDNHGPMDHPVHLHRHTFEITRLVGERCVRVFKDVVLVPARTSVEADILENNPGPALFQCHQQFHMDFRFMALMHYAE
jgi:FtsP/CotA-like multicopper oxidase with cupredoxin domain